jgi:adenine-specific DNA-methyltransferase
MEKLDLTTPNFTDENIQKISELFPNCVTEDADGKSIDFDALKQELSSNNIEGNKERYQLTWPGKAESLVTANTPINKTLRPNRKESKDFNNTENLYIEGDNLEVLKLLQETYLGKIKMIYIDPPYNTGKDFVYKDNFTQDKAEYDAESGNIDDEGGRLVSNPDSNGRYHSDWLSMIYPRLKLARNLLKDDGVIFISIDDKEMHNLRKICDEIFGEGNFVGTIGWESKTKSQNTKDSFNKLQPKVESIFVYAKKPKIRFNLISKGHKEYPESDEKGKFRYALIEQMNSEDMRGRATMIFPIEGIEPNNGKQWKIGKDTVLEFEERGDIFIKNDKPYRKMRPKDERSDTTEPFWGFFSKDLGTAESGKKELSNLIEKHGFDTVKPVEIIYRLILHTTEIDDVVLDFFSGSATTAQAVIQLNAKDSGNRKFIMVQIPETTDEKSEAYKAGYKTIAEIGKERIRRAGEKIKEDNADKEGVDELDVGFRVLKVDSSNMKDVYFSPDNTSQVDMLDQASNIKEDRTEEDLLFMVLLDWGIDLSVKIERREVAGKTVYFADDNFLAACFEDNLDEDFVKALVMQQPLKVVLRDSGFASSSVKINVEQIFKQADIEVKVI